MLCLIHGIKQILQVARNKESSLSLEQLKHLPILGDDKSNSLYAIAINNSGLIEAIGQEEDIFLQFKNTLFQSTINSHGKCILPGFVDAHTHPVWSGDRVHEFSMKLAGASYMEIHEAGGGIHFTVEHTTKASEVELFNSLKDRLLRMLRKGTTTVECKTGYGLHWSTEEKMLRVLTRAKRELPLDISITFLSGHAVPKGSTAEEATCVIVDEQLPQLKKLLDEKSVCVDNIDVFCEKGVFDIDQSRRILAAGQKLGLMINFHADELNPLGGAELAGSLSARAASHLEEISSAGIEAMSRSGTVAVLLPTTAYMLRLRAPPARQMLLGGVKIALGSDFNPNAFCVSMPLVMHLGCVLLHLSLDESLAAATLHAAHSINMADKIGSIEVGKQADLVIVDAPRWEHLIYQFGEADTLITHVLKKGKLIYQKYINEFC